MREIFSKWRNYENEMKMFSPIHRVLLSHCSPLFFYFVSFNQFQFFKYSIQVWVLRAILTPQLSYILITFEWQPKQLGTFWLNCQLERRTKSAHKHRVYIYTFYIPCILMLVYNETCSNLRIDLCQSSLSEKTISKCDKFSLCAKKYFKLLKLWVTYSYRGL